MTILNSNKGILSVAKEMFSGLPNTAKAMTESFINPHTGAKEYYRSKTSFMDAIKQSHKGTPGGFNVGGYSVGKIAGSYMGLSAGYRVLSGGGIYKDNNGNTDVIGIPFV